MQPNGQNFDATQTLRESFDPALERLRVEALISDGVDALIINPDGSINEVPIINGSPVSNTNPIPVVVVSGGSTGTFESVYNEVTSVASGTPTIVQTYIVPLATTANIQRIQLSGTNIAMYELLINSVLQDKIRTYFLDLNGEFVFSDNGYPLVSGDIVEIQVTHNRPDLGDFNSRIQVVEQP